MTSSGPFKILSIDEDRTHQEPIAAEINRAGYQLRFLTDPAKALAGLHQFKPNLLLWHSEVRASSTTELLTAIANDVTFANLPIVLLCDDDSDAPYVHGLRTGIVALWKKPFRSHIYIPELHHLVVDLPRRPGRVFGRGGSVELAQLVEHVRRTVRSGLISFNPRTPDEGRASFINGRLESASFQALTNVQALIRMVTQSTADWSFAELGGAGGEGSGVVIDMDVVTEPVTVEAPLDDEPLVAVLPSRLPADVPPPPASLLLVDDDPSLGKLFGEYFRKNKFEVHHASDGWSGFERAIGTPVDVVIADLNMPRMDGWGMLRLMRDDARSREIPVAFLSCHDDYRDALQAINAGAQGYFSKGTRLEQLVRAVRELLGPRLNFRHRLAQSPDAALRVDGLGPLWTLREIERRRFTGRMDARDDFAQYEFHFIDGAPTHATAQSGPHQAHGDRAFTALISSQGVAGLLHPRSRTSAPPNLRSSLENLIANACATLNTNDRRVRDELLVRASKLQINSELYALYARVGPKDRLSTARILCEQGLTPREIIASTMASPIEVEETLKDLLRRGVVSLAS